MSSRKRQARKERYSGRLKLPDGTVIKMPDMTHPGRDAVLRIKAGTPQPGDQQAADEWTASIDPRYVQYIAWLNKQPDTTAGAFGKPPQPDTPLGKEAMNTIGQMFISRFDAGTLGMCAHVRRQAPRAARWLAWAPEKLRCAECSDMIGATIKGTKRDYICDACGHHTRRIRACSKLLPPILYREVMVRVLMIYGLCPRCATPEPPDDEVPQGD